MPTHVLARTVSETDGYRCIARLAPVASPRGTLSFTLWTTWRDAAGPRAADEAGDDDATEADRG